MADLPKRVWTKKGMVFNDKRPVRTKDGKLGVYDPNFTEVDSGEVYPESGREDVAANEELIIYDSMEESDIGTFEDGLEATYTFKDWDGTVLKTGKVKDGETPEAPENPTREGYEFTGWNPAVGPITKSTEYVAQYEQVIVNRTITIISNDDTMGTVDISEVVVPDGTVVEAYDNILVIGETSITATAETGYVFSRWETSSLYFSPITEDCSYVAVFESDTPGAFDIPTAISWYDSSDKTILFADSVDSADRVEIEYGTDLDTGLPAASVTGYGIYAFSDPATDLQQKALMDCLSDIGGPTLMTQFANWSTYTGEYGTIVTPLMEAFVAAWNNYETQAYWDAVKTIINDTTTPVVNTNTIFAQSVGQPDQNSVTVAESGTTTVRFNYLPITVSPLEGLTAILQVESDDYNVAEAQIQNISYDGEAILDIYGVGAGTATITYQLSGSQDIYSISVTVTAAPEEPEEEPTE